MIVTQDVRFSYPNLNFSFPDLQCTRAETILITGKSGTGKTTFLHILSGILKPTSGSVQIDQTDIVSLSAKQLDNFRGKNIGLVLQESHFIASLSVLDNVILASWLSDKTLKTQKAMTLLNELGLENQIHKKTSQLSIGQKQRVSIARALIKDAKILLLDDCLSAVDTETEEMILNNLTKVMENKTTIIVSHRVSVARNADKIIVLDEGKIIEQGSHNELISQNGYYKELYEMQLSEKELS